MRAAPPLGFVCLAGGLPSMNGSVIIGKIVAYGAVNDAPTEGGSGVVSGGAGVLIRPYAFDKTC